jgi:transcriptional regulator GlxA family with amidase domain
MTRTISMLCFGGAQILDITGPLEVFARTSRWLQDHHGLDEPPYTVELVSMAGGPVRMSNGLEMLSAPVHNRPVDTLLICGGIGALAAADDPALTDWLQAAAGRARRVAGVCTGAIILAAAGLLANRKATTHWAYLDRLQDREPGCAVDRTSIYVRDGDLVTSAGVTAGMDMALALVEEDHGRAVALHVAQELVIYLRRPGDQAQFSRHVAAELRDTPFAALESWVIDHLDADLGAAALAGRAGLSERQFYRRFIAEIGASPAAWVRDLRLAAARRHIEQGARSLKDVARRCGFGDEQRLRRAFQARLGVTPSDYAQRFG